MKTTDSCKANKCIADCSLSIGRYCVNDTKVKCCLG